MFKNFEMTYNLQQKYLGPIQPVNIQIIAINLLFDTFSLFINQSWSCYLGQYLNKVKFSLCVQS